MKRRTKWIAFGLLAVLIVGWPARAHYRLKARLEAYQRRLKAAGEKLTIAELTPVRSPEAFHASFELMRAVGQFRPSSPSSNYPPVMKRLAPGRALVAWQVAVLPTDLQADVWPTLRADLDRNQPALREVCGILQSPELAFPLDYQQGFTISLGHLSQLKSAAQWLSAAAVLDLHEGRSAEAWARLQALTALAQRWDHEPIIISELVRVAIGSIAVNTLWEALQSPEIPRDSLKEIQAAWESIDLLDQAESCLAMDRAVISKQMFADVRASCGAYTRISGSTGTAATFGLSELTQLGREILDNPSDGFRSFVHRYPGYWIWKGWQSYDDERANAEWVQAGIEAIRAARNRQPWGEVVGQYDKESLRLNLTLPQAGAWLGGLPTSGEVLRRFLLRIATLEIQRSLLVSAIALKRYQLDHGVYPASLAQLSPGYLREIPRDPMDGKPLRYRLNPDGSFVLYSVGDDAADNGGDPNPPSPPTDRSTPRKQWYRARDAVWPQPASAAEIKADFDQLTAKRR